MEEIYWNPDTAGLKRIKQTFLFKLDFSGIDQMGLSDFDIKEGIASTMFLTSKDRKFKQGNGRRIFQGISDLEKIAKNVNVTLACGQFKVDFFVRKLVSPQQVQKIRNVSTGDLVYQYNNYSGEGLGIIKEVALALRGPIDDCWYIRLENGWFLLPSMNFFNLMRMDAFTERVLSGINSSVAN